MPQYVEQDGNIFKVNGKGGHDYVPKQIEQNGNIFNFDVGKKDYVFAGASTTPIETPKQDGPLMNRALTVGFQKGATLQARPAIAGVGSALGAYVGNRDMGKGVMDSLSAGADAYSQGRDEAIAEQADLAKKYPKSNLVGEIGGSLLTAPLLPVKGLMGAIKVGSIAGTGQAVGEAHSLGEAAQDIGTGAAVGGVTYGIGKGLQKTYEKGTELIKGLIPEKALAKIASATTGVSERDIINYAKQTDEINGMIDKFGHNIPEAVDIAKEKLAQSIQSTKKDLSNQISNALREGIDNYKVTGDVVEPVKTLDVSSVVNSIEKVKSSMHSVTKEGERAQVDALLNLIKRVAPNGEADLADTFAIQKMLQDNSKKGFVKNGAFFAQDTDVARAAMAGYNEARGIVNEVSPVIKAANQKYHQLHILEDNLNKNLIAPGKSESAFLAAGAGQNTRNETILNKLGELTGTDPVAEAQKISAARSFANTKLLPQGEATGYALGRIGVGAGIGAGVAKLTDNDWKTGAAIGAAATGPTALKGLINTGNITGKVINKAISVLDNPAFQSLVSQNLGRSKKTDEQVDVIKRRLQNAR